MDASQGEGRAPARPCPQCGRSFAANDQHEACPVCLGILHARRALSEPESCAPCSLLRPSALKRRVKLVEKVMGRTAVNRQDPLLSQSAASALSEPADMDCPTEPPVFSWADHMEQTEDLEGFPRPGSASPPPSDELAEYRDDDDVLDLGLDVHGLSEEEDQGASLLSGSATAAAGASRGDLSFTSLCRRAAVKLDLEWPSAPPTQKPSRFEGSFLPPEPMAMKTSLPLLPEFLTELTSTWSKPLSSRATKPGYGQYSDVDGAEKAGLVGPPRMEPTLAAYLAPAQNRGVSGLAILPSKHCRFSSAQLEKIYCAQAGSARALNSVSMLETYQGMCLSELAAHVPEDSPLLPLLNEVRLTSDHILRAARCAAVSLGRSMAHAVVAQRHLWLTLSDVSDRDRTVYLDEPVSADGLFGKSLDDILSRFEVRRKQTEALRTVIPRREAQPKLHTSRTAPPPPKRMTPVAGPSSQPVKQHPPSHAPRQSAWSKGPPPSLHKSSAPRRKHQSSS